MGNAGGEAYCGMMDEPHPNHVDSQLQAWPGSKYRQVWIYNWSAPTLRPVRQEQAQAFWPGMTEEESDRARREVFGPPPRWQGPNPRTVVNIRPAVEFRPSGSQSLPRVPTAVNAVFGARVKGPTVSGDPVARYFRARYEAHLEAPDKIPIDMSLNW